ncbi:MAG: CDP-diacylglycerol--glycerol-3-phosphate 3-phosphatidyltransferase [Deltaproteobacteria bacterium GWC2_42_11]|nr:MAG: CDP-diacylglycerol--glycerol-3-phosphate 3-phosphatidyltransferase [Deltaproteobacteria bacterium GWC2_42_11]HBO84825.1 CDP-diacylglycerol--glycerol-3-phosphate 3-phosphatidyltransferase [Deltaproteobacteria bacterium]
MAAVGINIPNLLTISRILLVPVFIIFIINDELSKALIVFIAAGITDALDGLIARLFNQKTLVGAYLDPVADKLILMSAYITLAIKDILPNWLSVVVVSRDVIILIGIIVLVLMDKEIKIRPSIVSKITTMLQVITVISVIMAAGTHVDLIFILIMLTMIFTIASGIHYMYRGIKILG